MTRKMLGWNGGNRALLQASLYYNRKRRKARQADSGGPTLDDTHLLLHFDSDTQAMDSSIYGRNGTFVGGAAITQTDKVFGDGSLSIATENEMVSFEADDIFAIGGTVPFEADWRFKIDQLGIDTSTLISAIEQSTKAGWALATLVPDYNEIRVISGLAYNLIWSNIVLDLEKWHAFKFNHDGAGNYRLYIDGDLLDGVPQATLNPMPATSVVPFIVAGRPAGDGPEFSQLDEFRWRKGPELVIEKAVSYVVADEPFPNP